ncbi:hypothetical protein AM588_10009578 [Phytophthora nicotianae]|uniref:Zinc finger PHD-type domain-containing protein n=1 Tax=Phytophthora nicotianae TaxID=4792 RepID=A0A0W8CUR1_PHYNI|nr:hypothetical protein AM588_10009578 [Phytophthora nicotianae]
MPDSTPAPLSCPVCFERFPTAAGTAFALHLASCSRSSPSPPESPTSAAHCPRCFHVYAAGTLAHEISFHEHECARVNDLPDAENDESASSTTGRKPKRQRNDVRVEATPSVTLFPSHCFLCGNGGRGLLHCSGSCARAAHQNCVDQLQAPTVGEPLSVAERKQAAENWKCAQCLRGLHRCQRCGFLGHEANGMRKCSVLDCGYHFHEQCLETDETTHTGFVCPRHTCATCGTQETDMTRCKSCSVCYHMTHFRCPSGSGASTGASTNNGGLDPINLFVCPRHDAETTTSPTSNTQDTQQDSDSCSQASATVRATSPDSGISNHTIGPDANRNKRSADVIESGDVKRQKVSTESPALEAPVFTPTNFCGLQPGATLSSASAPATLHISPMASSSRTILPQKRKQLTRKQKLLADMPKLVLEDLERTAFRYLEEADASRSKPAPVPTDSDAFPWAARAANFRPAFYRPTVMLGHSGLRRPGVDAVSRLLVSQDKRSIKCFVQTLEANEDLSKCSHVDHLDKKASSASPGFVLLDLMTLSSFRELELVVRTRLVEALGKRSRYTRDHFGMDAYQAQRWLEQQRRRKASDQPPISLSYCAVDGVRRHIELKESTKQSPKDKQKWLCFCANVRHLSVAITVPNVTRSALKSMVAPQQVAGTAK